MDGVPLAKVTAEQMIAIRNVTFDSVKAVLELDYKKTLAKAIGDVRAIEATTAEMDKLLNESETQDLQDSNGYIFHSAIVSDNIAHKGKALMGLAGHVNTLVDAVKQGKTTYANTDIMFLQAGRESRYLHSKMWLTLPAGETVFTMDPPFELCM